MKKTLALICVVTIFIVGISCVTVSADPRPLKIGDANFDGNVNIKDVTEIQKCLADLCTFDIHQEYSADVDADDEVTIKDATLIQKYLSGIVSEFSKTDGYISVYAESIYADYDSGVAMAGVPVTFTAIADGYMEPFSYEFIIDDKVVSQHSEKNTLTYTFEDPGFYFITVNFFNSLNVSCSVTTYYEVVEPYTSDALMVKAFYFDKSFIASCVDKQIMSTADKNITITAEAMMGSGMYEYRFIIDDKIVRDFSQNNQYFMQTGLEKGEHSITVSIRDMNNPHSVISKTIPVTVVENVG